MTKGGYIKQTVVSDFKAKRNYRSSSSVAIKLQNDADVLLNVYEVKNESSDDIFLVSRRGYGLRYPLAEVSTFGPTAKGVKSINQIGRAHV